MMVITVWQPWASLIAIGAKRLEFRGWPAPASLHAQRIGIHAAKRPARRGEVADLIDTITTDAKMLAINPGPALDLLDAWWRGTAELPLSSILCTAEMGTPITGAPLMHQLGIKWLGEGTNYGWPLIDVRQLEPIVPARGAQGFWRWNPTNDQAGALVDSVTRISSESNEARE